jgi:Cytochrome C oxidase, cbb3-type, subunit III
MGKVVKLLGLLLVLVVAGAAVFVATFKPKSAPASTEVVERTPARLARGKYLVDAVLGCMDCHAKHDLSRFGGPLVGPEGGGDPQCWDETYGMPGRVCIPNITPDKETGIGAWSDGEIIRAIREGINREGKGLFPSMPYNQYRALSDEDVRAVVVYLRALPPAQQQIAKSEIKFPVSFFVKMVPKPVDGPVAEPNRDDRVAYGKYLAKVSGCQFCHTPVDGKHQPIEAMAFAGGYEFKGPWGVVRSSNLTPHETGLGARDEKAFVGMFKAFDVPAADLPTVPLSQATVMPWLARARMTEADLGAVHAFLRTVPPVDRVIEKRPLPSLPARQAGGSAPAAEPAAPAPAAK